MGPRARGPRLHKPVLPKVEAPTRHDIHTVMPSAICYTVTPWKGRRRAEQVGPWIYNFEEKNGWSHAKVR
jgi:hypothetical protein